jgi:hypothetical protein
MTTYKEKVTQGADYLVNNNNHSFVLFFVLFYFVLANKFFPFLFNNPCALPRGNEALLYLKY